MRASYDDRKMYDNVFFGELASLGDCIVLNAITLDLARKSKKLYIPSRYCDFDTLSCLYKDEPNIEVVAFASVQETASFISTHNLHHISQPLVHRVPVFYPGMTKPLHLMINWDRQIYENCGYHFSLRYSGFKLPDVIEGEDELYDRLTKGETEYILFHRFTGDHPNGIDIRLAAWRKHNGLPDMKIIEVKEGQTTNFLQYRKLILNAIEIHVVPSSLFCLVDSIRVPGKLFYHDIRYPTLMQINSHVNPNTWTWIHYAQKL